MESTTRKKRIRNQEAGAEEIFNQLCEHLQLNKIEDGDEKCKALKRRAMEELPHAIGQLAAQGYCIYYSNEVTSYEGLNFETYKQLDRISAMADPIGNWISTFKRALRYFVTVYCRAYSIAEETKRDSLFNDALVVLVATYPLYVEREYTLVAEQEPLVI